jgi:hypothetical protein
MPSTSSARSPDFAAAARRSCREHLLDAPPRQKVHQSDLIPSGKFIADLSVSRDASACVIMGRTAAGRLRLATIRSWTPPKGGRVDLPLIRDSVLRLSSQYPGLQVGYDQTSGQSPVAIAQRQVDCRPCLTSQPNDRTRVLAHLHLGPRRRQRRDRRPGRPRHDELPTSTRTSTSQPTVRGCASSATSAT